MRDAALEFVASSGACALGYGVTHPLETIKVRQMCLPAGSASPLRLAVDIVRAEGAQGLFVGIKAGLARSVAQGGCRLCFYDQLKGALPAEHRQNDAARLLAGSLAGALAALVGQPIDTVRTTQQADTAAGAARGVVHVTRQLVAEAGVLSLWRGSSAAVARCAVLTASQCATYDRSKGLLTAAPARWRADELRTHVGAALISGVVTTTATVPLDNIKTTMIVSNAPAAEAAALVYRSGGGALGFLRGWGSVYVRLAPHTVIMFCALERLRALFGIERRDESSS